MILDKGKRTIINMLDYAAEEFASYDYTSYKTEEGWTHFTYRQIRDNSNAIAASLLEIGIKPGDNLAILSEGSPMWVMAEFGALTIQAVSVPLSVKLLPGELPYRLNHSEAKAIFVSRNNLDKVLKIIEEVDNPDIKIIYLDNDHEYFHSKIISSTVNSSNGFVFWDLLDKGRKLFNIDPEKINRFRTQIKENDVVNISYTSGTTGEPKGIMLTHLNYYSNTTEGLKGFKLKKRFRTLIILPVDHCFSHTVALYGALFKGLDLYFLDTRGGTTNALKNIPINLKEVKPEFLLTVPALTANFMNKIKEGVKEKGSFIYSVFERGLKAGNKLNNDGINKPGLFVRLWNYFPYKIASILIYRKLKMIFGGELQYMVGGGALLDIKQQQFYYAIGSPVFQGYGLTEASPIISANTPHTYKLGTSGKMLDNITCRFMVDENREAAKGEIGELVIKGENVMKGYYKNSKATEKTLKDGWLWTGDLGYIDENGFLMITGRNKALLISEDGEKYSPEAIEEAIVNTSELIQQTMVHNDHKKYTTAVVTLDRTKMAQYRNKSEQEVLSIVQQELHAFKNDPVYKGKFPSKWTPSQFFIAPEPFSEDNKMVNSTLKMVRHKITESYKEEIKGLYKPGNAEKIQKINSDSISKMLN